MQFTLQLPTDRVAQGEEFVSAEAIAEMARATEQAGFDAAFVTDHPAPEDRWLASGGHQALDPFVALSFVAAATTRLRVQTHVLVASYRNPFLAAKAIATLDVLSRGRVIVGLAAGYLEAEFAALGVDYAERNERVIHILPANVSRLIEAEKTQDAKARRICDFLSGQTDGMVVRTYRRLFDPEFGSFRDLS